MTEKQHKIIQLLRRAIRNFNKKEQYLIKNRLCERCICARFAMYLERSVSHSFFHDYTTDLEYDKGMGGSDGGKKKIFGHDAYLDLIVHKRGHQNSEVTGYDNLFAIEMKWQGEDFYEDKERLKVLVDNENQFNYRAGFAIRIISNPSISDYRLVIEESFFNNEDF